MKRVFNFVRIIAFALLVAILLGYWNEVFKFKDQNGMVGMDIYYSQPENSVDMLIVGSSHAFTDINTGTLWNEYGIASYLLGANVQPLSNSYHYIQEALKTQSPEVIVLEGFLLTEDTDYMSESFIINNTYGLHFSEDSMVAMNDTIPPDADLMEYGLYYGRYHSRYDELSSEDFTYGTTSDDYYSCFKGFHCLRAVTPTEEPHFNRRRDITMPLSLRVEYYYRKICELCQDRNINLVIVISPYAYYNYNDRMKYCTGREIASEYGFDFIDYNEYYDQMNLDFETDFHDQGHLNAFGSRKYTSLIGSYIDENFDLPDRRLDCTGTYDTWELNARFLDFDYYELNMISSITAEEFFAAVRELPDDYILIFRITNPRHILSFTSSILGYYDIPSIRFASDSVWVVESGVTNKYVLDDNGLFFDRYYGVHHLAVDNVGVYFDDDLFLPPSSGLEINVINQFSGSVVESITLDNDLIWR
ncbi:MAG: hypothetical protein MJ094_02470 [Saccharofermentans sp.]|nr:hypothetical protein [Saccharofermentans sp.]